MTTCLNVRSKVQIPEDINHALALVAAGKLFELQQWIADGNRLRTDELEDRRFCCLYQACERGFHSMVDVLLKAGGWSQEEKDDSLNHAMHEHRMDLVELLLAHGAQTAAIDFQDVCRTVNLELMERFLRAGVDPAAGNAFARALDDIKARPLLKFYRDRVAEFPALKGQMALALTCAVREKKTRWAALLAWAGADPFMRVPHSLYEGWDLGDYGGWTAAEAACFSGEPDLVKALKLRPDPETLQELLYRVTWHPSVEVMKMLIRGVAPEALNSAERRSCKAVEKIIDHRPDFGFRRMTAEQEGDALAACLEVLLDAGARWNPDFKEIGSVRRDFVRNSPRYIVRVLRLLLYVPGAADRATIIELCRTPIIRRKIYEGDRTLADELDELADHVG